MPHHLTEVPAVLLTTEETARRLGFSRRAILNWAETGKLPSILTPGGHRRYPAVGVERAYRQMYGIEQ